MRIRSVASGAEFVVFLAVTSLPLVELVLRGNFALKVGPSVVFRCQRAVRSR